MDKIIHGEYDAGDDRISYKLAQGGNPEPVQKRQYPA
jgi:hypothetical protein